jgi:serine/threonine protein kinase
VAEDKKTQLGQPGASQTAIDTKPKTSYLPVSDDPLLGTTLAGRYLIDKKLGEGGMGAVYLATHNLLEKQVALKILHGEFARKPDLVERFMQEAKAASRIRHENVIDISDFGATPEGMVFFAMELLKGHDLHDEIARARVSGHLLPWSRTKKIFLQICAALSAAHAKSVVHRDLKPENIYLVEFLGDPDFVKLLDFGIAKLTETTEDGGGGRKLTKTGMLFGTPEYMSPEQARGEHVDHRVDIYAMGCILFQLVTNRVPFEAENFMGVLSMHLTEPPPSIPPEVFDQIGAPRALAQVIDRALDKDRNQRYQTIDELANAVRAVCGDPAVTERTTTPRPASVPSPAQTTTRRAATPTPSPTPVGNEASTRVRTQWTGNLSVPEEVVDRAPKPRSKLPLFLGGGVIVIGGAIAVAVMLGGKPAAAPAPAPAPPTTGSAAVAPSVTPGSAATVAKPPPELTGMISLQLHSTPEGATVTDMSSNSVVGKTPCSFSAPASRTTRRFSFHLRGYGDAIAELPLDGSTPTYQQALTKGATATPAVVIPRADAPQVKPIGSGEPSGVVTRPDQLPVTQPEPPKAGSADPGDITPTLKTMPSK